MTTWALIVILWAGSEYERVEVVRAGLDAAECQHMRLLLQSWAVTATYRCEENAS